MSASTPDTPHRTLIAPCIRSERTECVYVVISRQFIQELERLCAEHNTTLRLKELPYPSSEPEQYEAVVAAWRQLARLVGLEPTDGMLALPVLERAVALLQGR